MQRLLQFIFGGWGQIGLAAGAFAILFGWWQLDRAGQRAVGEKRAERRIEKANDDAVQTVNRARQRSRGAGGGVREGTRDPYTVD